MLVFVALIPCLITKYLYTSPQSMKRLIILSIFITLLRGQLAIKISNVEENLDRVSNLSEPLEMLTETINDKDNQTIWDMTEPPDTRKTIELVNIWNASKADESLDIVLNVTENPEIQNVTENNEIIIASGPKPCDKIDLFFVIDGSISIQGNHDFELLEKFLASVLDDMPEDARVGAVQFASGIWPEFSFNTFSQTENKPVNFNRHNWILEATNLGQAIEYTLDNELTEESGDRPDALDVVVIVTYGEIEDDAFLSAHRLRQKGIVLVLGITGFVDKGYLNALAGGNENNVFAVENFEALDSISVGFKKRLFLLMGCPIEDLEGSVIESRNNI